MSKICDGIEIEVNAHLSVSDETAERCMRLLEMWCDDNPDKTITCDVVNEKHQLRIKKLKKLKTDGLGGYYWQEERENNATD